MNEFLHREAYEMLLGEQIGFGRNRKVYVNALNPKTVVKVEDSEERDMFQNVVEWRLWCTVQYTKFAQYFAPCLYISPNGRIMIMRRTDALSSVDYPKTLPKFFTDFQRRNYGMLNRRFVCHDYGIHRVTEKGLTHATKRVKWW